jgi:hypothetical protein
LDAGDYCVVFQSAERNYPATGSTQPVSVQIDGQTVSTILPVGIAYQVYYTVPFTVAAGDHTLTFRTTTTGGDNTAFVDNVQVISPASIVPQAAATATVASSGKMISLTFTGLANGRSAVPSQILAAPSLVDQRPAYRAVRRLVGDGLSSDRDVRHTGQLSDQAR